MPHIKKAQAGNDTFGNTWEHDGDVVEVSHEQSVELLAIDDAGFTLVADAGEGADEGVGDGAGAEFSEVDPKAGADDSSGDSDTLAAAGEGASQAPVAPKKTAARKTAASKPE